jgi:flagellar hook-length control protein FliK
MSPPLTGGQQLDMVKQVANHIETLALTKPGQAVTIQLRPEGLGDVTVVVKSLGTGIEATLTASNESVRTALSDNRDALTQAATVKGFNLVSVHVAGQSSTNSNSGSQSAPKQHAAQLANQSSTHHGMSGNSGSQKESRRSNGPSVNPISTLDSLTGESSTPFAVTPDGLDYRT